MDIITIMLPVFLLIAAGTILKRTKVITDESAKLLNLLAYNIALPSLIFSTIAKFRITELFEWKVIAALIIASLLICLVAWLITRTSIRKIPARTGSAFVISSFHGNLVYLGFPIILAAYGSIGLAKAGIIVAVLAPFAYLVSVIILRKYQLKNKKEKLFLVNDPLFIACFLGVLTAYFSIQIPAALTTVLDLVGGMALPIGLLCLGACMHFDKIRHKLSLNFALAALKLLLMPLICYLLLQYVFIVPSSVPALDMKIAVLLSAMPVAVSTFILADKWKSDSEFVAANIVLTTILALASLSLLFIISP